jgi:hypothetical protein
MSFMGTANVRVVKTEIHHVRADGIDLSQDDGVELIDNECHDFQPALGNHPDCHQFTTGQATDGSRRILIMGESVVTQSGAGMQGLFLNDESKIHPFYDVQMLCNLVIGGYGNGILISGGTGVAIEDNTVTGTEGGNQVMIRLTGDISGPTRGNGAQLYVGFGITPNYKPAVPEGNVLIPPVNDGGQALVAAWRSNGCPGPSRNTNRTTGRR